MHLRFRLPSTAFALLFALGMVVPSEAAAQSVEDYRLPTAPTPTANPSVQGPVDTESGIIPVRPRVIPTARPSPSATAPIVLPEVRPTPAPRAAPPPAGSLQRAVNPAPARVTAQTPSRPAGVQQASPAQQEPDLPATPPIDQVPIAPADPVVPAALPAPSLPAASSPAGVPATADADAGEGFPLAAMAGLAALLVAAGAFFVLRRRRPDGMVPEIERPQVGTGPSAGLADFQLAADAVKLTRSMAYATLDYQVTLFNRAASAACDIVLSADLVTAHGGAPMESQLASTAQSLEQRHVFARISPGQTVRHQGKLQIPLAQARIIRQGSASLIVPLLRVRLDREGDGPVVRTFVIGQGIPGGERVAPFRLDDGPRSYAPVAARALD